MAHLNAFFTLNASALVYMCLCNVYAAACVCVSACATR